MSALYLDAYASPIEDTLISKGLASMSTYPLFASNTLTGAIFGSLLAGPLSEWVGIKSLLIIFSPLSVIGSFLIIIGMNPASMVIGRGLIGVYAGMGLSCSPVYNSEIAPPHLKQIYGSVYNLSIGVGISLCYLLGIWLGFRWLPFVYLSMVAFMVLNLLLLPESPKWLLKKGMLQSAKKARAYFYDSEVTDPLIPSDSDGATHSSENKNPSLRDDIYTYIKWPVIRPLLVCSTIQIFKCSSGYAFLLVYSSHTLESGVKLDPNVVSLFSPLSILLGSVTFMFVIKRVNWKRLLMLTTFVQMVCNVLLGVTLHLSSTLYSSADSSPFLTFLQYAPIAITSCFFFCMGLGWGSISWLLYGELLHPHYTRVSAGIVTFLCYLSAALNQLIGPLIVAAFGNPGVFYGYGIMCLLGLGVQYFY